MSSILHDLQINASPEKVFEGISSPSLLDEWWTKNSKGVPAINEIYELYFSPEYVWKGKVTKYISPNEFELEIFDSHPDWDNTKVGFHISGENNNTKLSFYHSDWKQANEHFRISSYCWASYLRILKGYLEKGIRVPYEERDIV